MDPYATTLKDVTHFTVVPAVSTYRSSLSHNLPVTDAVQRMPRTDHYATGNHNRPSGISLPIHILRLFVAALGRLSGSLVFASRLFFRQNRLFCCCSISISIISGTRYLKIFVKTDRCCFTLTYYAPSTEWFVPRSHITPKPRLQRHGADNKKDRAGHGKAHPADQHYPPHPHPPPSSPSPSFRLFDPRRTFSFPP